MLHRVGGINPPGEIPPVLIATITGPHCLKEGVQTVPHMEVLFDATTRNSAATCPNYWASLEITVSYHCAPILSVLSLIHWQSQIRFPRHGVSFAWAGFPS